MSPDNKSPLTSETIELMLNHRSVRKFTDKTICESDLASLVSAGQAAASSSFIQAYSIIRVSDASVKKQIAAAAGGQKWINQAPEFLVYCADLKRVDYACVQQEQGALEGHTEHFIAATVDVALVAQNIMLAAESIGLGGVYIGGIRNDPQLLADLLELPDQVYPVFGMCLGWPAVNPDIKPRFPVASIFHHEKYQAEKIEANVQAYDNQMQAYYQSRDSNSYSSNWSKQTAKAVQQKKREHMRSILQKYGLLKL